MKILFLSAVILAGCSVSNKDSEGILVSTSWLKNLMNDSSVAILHVGSEEVFDSIHIPGARHINPNDFTIDTDELRNELPPMDSIIKLLRLAGVNTDSRIVLYSENDRLIARTARIFLTLDYAGLSKMTFVLNGGLPQWIEEGMETTDLASEVEEGNLKAGESREVVIRAQDLNQQRWNHEYIIIDARSEEEYYGEVDSTGLHVTGGHIEGASFMDYENLLSDTSSHMFLADAELLKEFQKVGMDSDKTAVSYCGSGIRASLNYLVARHLGYPALLYDGSIQEWEMLAFPVTSPVIAPSNND